MFGLRIKPSAGNKETALPQQKDCYMLTVCAGMLTVCTMGSSVYQVTKNSYLNV